MKTRYPLKLMISGSTIAELKENARKFLEEADGTKSEQLKQDAPVQNEASPFGAPPPVMASTADIPQQDMGGHAQVRPESSGTVQPGPALPEQTASVPSQVGGAARGSVSFDGVDVRGFPWDKRIHAISGGKNKDGSWRYRRGIEDAEVDRVEFELKSKMSQPTPVVPSQQPPLPIQPVSASSPEAPSVAPQVATPPQSVAQPVQQAAPYNPAPAQAAPEQHPPIPAPAPVTLTHSFETFKAQLVPTLAELAKQGRITQEYIAQLCQHFGVEYLHQVNDEQARMTFENFVGAGLIKRV